MSESQAPLQLRARIAQAFEAYKSNTLLLLESDLTGFTHIVASRKGLYVVNEKEWRLVANGFFFGITFHGEDIWVFEACDQPHSSLRQGRIVRLEQRENVLTGAHVIATGLDNGCHQIDFIGEDLYVVDTYNQLLQRFSPGAARPEALTPLPPCEGKKEYPRYVHVNSILAVDDKILLMRHNGASHTNRKSNIAVYDKRWQWLEDVPLDGLGCHGFGVLEDGTLLTCGSMAGDIISPEGLNVHVSEHMTRGLAVGKEDIAIGGCMRGERATRLQSTGTVTFLDRNYKILNVLTVPGAPTEIRRLDGEDYGLSNTLARHGASVNLRTEHLNG